MRHFQTSQRLFQTLRSNTLHSLCNRNLPTVNSYHIQQTAAFHQHPTLMMKAARVTEWSSPPAYITVPDLPAPSSNELQLKVLAAGVPRAVKGRAAQKHPSAFGAPLPFDPSIDGVGLDEATGEMYFINGLAAPVFAERANVERSHLTKLEPGTDPASVAALANPASSSWMALQCRATTSCKDKTVVIVGATSASGRAAAAVARSLGAAKVVGISRNEDSLAAVEGLDERVLLRDPLELPPSIGPVHFVLDYVNGPVAAQLMRSAEIVPGENLEYIFVGGLSGEENVVVPARLINIKPIRIMASGVGSLSREEMTREMPGLARAMSKMKAPFEVVSAPMADVASVWNSEEDQTRRLVLVP